MSRGIVERITNSVGTGELGIQVFLFLAEIKLKISFVCEANNIGNGIWKQKFGGKEK